MSVFRRAAQRRGTPADYLVVGLGNPGDKFLGSRHNLGYEVVEEMAERESISLDTSKPNRARIAVINHLGNRVVLACPTTFMNLSGEAVASLIRRNGVNDVGCVIVVHDELDLQPGRVKVKRGGSAAGHNGLKSIRQHVGSDDFVRIRIGIGKPPDPQNGRNWVLRRPSSEDRSRLDAAVQIGVDAIETILRDGVEQAMNNINGLQS
ncbi:MAG: aminoacyl-tRNA hydrolase [Acidimicrobiales bacterium]|nr:aminoacyl-tRNA hydrolase [Acidimicrobiales bacterium]MDP6901869.1 aminoacyl-tRNA hydrolase [Acidimicrobiales bacterium]